MMTLADQGSLTKPVPQISGLFNINTSITTLSSKVHLGTVKFNLESKISINFT